MPREASITQNDITRAAIRLLRNGQHPSAQKVRTELGDRGSLSTIHDGLKAWRESLNDADLDILPAQMPKQLATPVEDFFNACMALAENQLAEHRQTASDEIEKAAGEVREAKARVEDLQSYAAELETKLDGRVEQVEQLKSSNEELRQQRMEASNLAQQNADRIDTLMSARDNDRKAHEREVDELKASFERDKEALLQRMKVIEENAAESVKSNERQLNYWMMEVDRERELSKAGALKHEQAMKRLDDELNIARRKADSMSVKISQTEGALLKEQDRTEELEALLEGVQADCDRQVQKREQTESELDAVYTTVLEQEQMIDRLKQDLAEKSQSGKESSGKSPGSSGKG